MILIDNKLTSSRSLVNIHNSIPWSFDLRRFSICRYLFVCYTYYIKSKDRTTTGIFLLSYRFFFPMLRTWLIRQENEEEEEEKKRKPINDSATLPLSPFFWRSYSFSLQGNFGLVMVAREWTIHTHTYIMTFSSCLCMWKARSSQ